MKINVTGRGFVPGINSIAPVYNKEADLPLIKRILNYTEFRIFDSETGFIITKRNAEAVYNSKVAPKDTTASATTTAETVKVEETPVVEEVVEAEEVTTTSASVDVDAVEVSDDSMESIVESTDEVVEETNDAADTEEETVVDETTSSGNQYRNTKKNRNKNKHHN